jgi:hypothetical protein
LRRDEAQWINVALREFLPVHVVDASANDAGPAPVVLNLGCGSRRAREQQKPHIHELTLKPVLERGYRLLNSDMFADDGVDLQGDLFDPQFVLRLCALQPALIFFCNVFEHVDAEARQRLPAILDSIVRPGGLILVTAPLSYPYHPDPIDTYYRVSPTEIAALFPGYRSLTSQAVECGNYGEEFFANSLAKRSRRVLRLLFPFIAPRRWLTLAHKFFWLRKPYQISCVLLRK